MAHPAPPSSPSNTPSHTGGSRSASSQPPWSVTASANSLPHAFQESFPFKMRSLSLPFAAAHLRSSRWLYAGRSPPAADIHLNGQFPSPQSTIPQMCVVSGPTPSIAAYEERLANQSRFPAPLFTSHAFHPDDGPHPWRIRRASAQHRSHAPRIPYLSNVTGTWIRPEEATDPAYWARHIRSTVRFSAPSRSRRPPRPSSPNGARTRS